MVSHGRLRVADIDPASIVLCIPPPPSDSASVKMAAEAENPIQRRMKSVKHIIIVLSGKGGVGKSSVTSQLALNLYASSPTARVGVLDIDLTGPSIPRMLGVDGHGVHQSMGGWVPVYADGAAARLACMSVGFLLKNKGDSVVWRGPKKNGMIRQFLSDVRWGDLDYLVIDTPPGECYFPCDGRSVPGRSHPSASYPCHHHPYPCHLFPISIPLRPSYVCSQVPPTSIYPSSSISPP